METIKPTERVQVSPESIPRFCILVNAGSGKQNGAGAFEKIENAVNKQGLLTEIRRLDAQQDIEIQARSALADGYRIIVAAGGDGTICAVAAAVAQSSTAVLGIIPLGTFNYFARSLGLSGDIPEAVRVLAAEHTKSMGLGYVNDRIFLNNASLGAYPAILETREKIYRNWGRSRIAAYWSVGVSLWQQRGYLVAEITDDHVKRRVKTAMIMCVSNAFQLREMQLREADKVNGLQMALYIARQRSSSQLFKSAWRLMRRAPQKMLDYDVLIGSDFTVRTRRTRQKVARDGEWHSETGPFRFHLKPDGLRVIIPEPKDNLPTAVK